MKRYFNTNLLPLIIDHIVKTTLLQWSHRRDADEIFNAFQCVRRIAANVRVTQAEELLKVIAAVASSPYVGEYDDTKPFDPFDKETDTTAK